MSIERPPTPPRSGFFPHDGSSFVETSETTSTSGSGKTNASSEHIPRLLDLIFPLKNALAGTSKYIPPTYLAAEAVDSSLLLGEGASFVASLQAIPKGPATIEVVQQSSTISLTKSTSAPSRPDFVVYKVARIAFAENGEALPEYRRALGNFLTEVHALTYPPLFHHENIINFLGFAWGSNPFSPAQRLPAVIVEYAKHGTLADLLRKTVLEYDAKHHVCLDIARGLSAVHHAGLVHGDVKAENILICTGQERQYTAKLADFGYSLVESSESDGIWMGGTNPWRAPEAQKPLSVSSLAPTDTFSFGLLIWLISIDGTNPFDLIIDPGLKGTLRDEKIEDLKESDTLLALAQKKEWLLAIITKKVTDRTRSLIETKDGNRSPEDQVGQKLALRAEISRRLYDKVCSMKLIRSLDDVFQHSLQRDPELRDLEVVEALLESDEVERVVAPRQSIAQPSENLNRYTIVNKSNEKKTYTRTSANMDEFLDYEKARRDLNSPEDYPKKAQPQENTEPLASIPQQALSTIPTSSSSEIPNMSRSFRSDQLSWSSRGHKRHWMSWQKISSLDPGLQALVFESLPVDEEAVLFILSAIYMNGYGCRTSEEQALHCMEQAAEQGSHLARAYMYRVFAACKQATGVLNPGAKFIQDYAKVGSRIAFDDFVQQASKEDLEGVGRWIRDASGGVGAIWYNRDQMLDGRLQMQWIEDDYTFEYLQQNPQAPNPVINKRGDMLIHFVASCGRRKPFESLVVKHKVDINIRNALGETPLLCALRAGQGGIVILCLKRYHADASIAAYNGETPLHWLSGFEDEYITPMTQDLIDCGAQIHAKTYQRVNHSKFDGQIDMEIKLPGTALHWAVHNDRPYIVDILLGHGANPNGSIEEHKAYLSPIHQAAYYHRHKCLSLMIAHLEKKVTVMTTEGKPDLRHALLYGPLVINAVHAADKFSMILRNGQNYKKALQNTLDLIREKTRMINFQVQVAGSLLYYAVSEAHDEIVDYMFEKDWLVDTINTPVGEAKRTPILEAVRWNRASMYHTLRRHGADIYALAANPFRPGICNWSALHIFAHEGHNKDVTLVQELISCGLPVDGFSDAALLPSATSDQPQMEVQENTIKTLANATVSAGATENISSELASLRLDKTSGQPLLPSETPFAVALRHNAFNLCTVLLNLRANPNALTCSSGLFSSVYPLTPLGHIIISNARYSGPRIRYLLNLPVESSGDEVSRSTDFIVEPHRQLTAFHRAAMANRDVHRVDGEEVKKQEFDFDTNAAIIHQLLLRWVFGREGGTGKEALDHKCRIRGNTALHLAIEASNHTAAQALVRAGASMDIENDDGETAAQMLKRLARPEDGSKNFETGHENDDLPN